MRGRPGVHLILPFETGTVTDSFALGAGDNNVGEVAGLLQLRLSASSSVHASGASSLATHSLLRVSDSLLVVGALEWG